jgi:uncharacterized circularly permuted ATP-grasp superfamily protein
MPAPRPEPFRDYVVPAGYDEAFDADGNVRPAYLDAFQRFGAYGLREFQRRLHLIELIFRNQGITFTVYGDAAGTERSFPFDPVPRILEAVEWAHLEAGLRQRATALNRFLADVYGKQEVLEDRVVPPELVLRNAAYRPQVRGTAMPHGAFTHVLGTDLIRDGDGRFLVLEDNARSPSGVSYMLANRGVMARAFPKMMAAHPVRPVRHYPSELLETLQSLSPRSRPPSPFSSPPSPRTSSPAKCSD